MRKIKEIIIHCSDTPAGRNVTIHDIDRWHRQNGWSGVGYHYVIYLDGSIHIGRPLAERGAHCYGHNRHSIGICYIGGRDQGKPRDTRTAEQRAALRTLVAELKQQFPSATVHGHNEFTCKREQSRARANYAECSRECTECEFAAKACPCFNVKKEFMP